MRQRDIRVSVHLNRTEFALFDDRVKKSGLTREAYLRHLMNGAVPREAPPPDYFGMMRELHKIGNNLNQITVKAHTLNVMDVKRYDEGIRQLEQAIRRITEAVILPRPLA